MREVFKDFRPQDELPGEIKSEVFKTFDSLRLLADIIDLFTLKFPGTQAHLVDLVTRKEGREDPAGSYDEETERNPEKPDDPRQNID